MGDARHHVRREARDVLGDAQQPAPQRFFSLRLSNPEVDNTEGSLGIVAVHFPGPAFQSQVTKTPGPRRQFRIVGGGLHSGGGGVVAHGQQVLDEDVGVEQHQVRVQLARHLKSHDK